jgi:hypothetical protein
VTSTNLQFLQEIVRGNSSRRLIIVIFGLSRHLASPGSPQSQRGAGGTLPSPSLASAKTVPDAAMSSDANQTRTQALVNEPKTDIARRAQDEEDDEDEDEDDEPAMLTTTSL